MKRALSIPLRVLLPVLLLSCAAIAGLISWKLATRLLTGEIESQFLDEARPRVTGLQATLEYHLRNGDASGVKLEISGMATRNDVIGAFVIDRHDRIMAATRSALIGDGAEAIQTHLPADLKIRHAVNLARVRASTQGIMELSQDRRVAVAYYPLLVDVDEHVLRSKRNGLVVLVLDTQIAKGRAFQAAGRQAVDNALVFGGLAACAWVFLHLSLSRRVAGLVDTTRRLASGDLAARTGLEGNDELALVATAVDQMADRIAEDILRQKQGEAKLRESEARFRQLAENIDHLFWMAAPGGEELIYVSPAYERMWGRTCASVYAEPQSWLEAIAAEDRPSVMAALIRNALGETSDLEYRVNRPDGTQHWMRDRGFPVRDEDGRVARVCGIVEDITARKQTEAELKKTHRELLEVSRHAGMAEVATSVLHNVGNVLNSVNTSLSVATSKVSRIRATGLSRIAALVNEHAQNLPAFFTEHPQGIRLPAFLTGLAEHFSTEQQSVLRELDSLRGNLEHINEIVAMQQSYAGAGGIIETVPLAEVIDDALRMNAAAFERHGTKVVRELDPALPSVTTDRNKLLLVLVNLVRNAKHACDENGAMDKRITIQTQLHDGDGARIVVTDNGIGIPPENLTRIFAHGFTTRKDGHGFGLHSSALAATEMGGALRVRSDGPGRGAAFTIELPIHRPKI